MYKAFAAVLVKRYAGLQYCVAVFEVLERHSRSLRVIEARHRGDADCDGDNQPEGEKYSNQKASHGQVLIRPEAAGNPRHADSVWILYGYLPARACPADY